MEDVHVSVNGNGVANGNSHHNLFETPSLNSIQGKQYIPGASILSQQVAYSLSSTIFQYADGLPETESAVQKWAKGGQLNPRGSVPVVEQLQTRTGAGIFVLGHSSVDVSKENAYPDSAIASSATIGEMQPVLSQLARSYNKFNPVVGHVSAIDVDSSANFVADYVTPLRTARESGAAAIISKSAEEVQYMSVLASLFSLAMPTLHVYDGIRLARELSQVPNLIASADVKRLFDTVRQAVPVAKKLEIIPHTTNVLAAFNNALQSQFSFFEYSGHPDAQTVLVVLGSTEASLAINVVNTLAQQGVSVGVVNIRIYQPFSDADFLATLPKSTQRIAVLGQVAKNDFRSILFEEVLAAIASTRAKVDILDVKYGVEQVWTSENFSWIFQQLVNGVKEITLTPEVSSQPLINTNEQSYVFWDIDNAASSIAARKVAEHFAADPNLTVSFAETYDNFSQTGTLYTEVRAAQTGTRLSVGPVESANVVVVSDVAIANSFNVVTRLASGGKLLVKTTIKPEDLEKKLPVSLKTVIYARKDDIEVYTINPKEVGQVGEDDVAENIVVELALLKLVGSEKDTVQLAREFSPSGASFDIVLQSVNKIKENIDTSLRKLEVPASWAELETTAPLPTFPRGNAYDPNTEKEPAEPESKLSTWHTAAQQIMFKESHEFQNTLRPELPIKNWVVTVQENKRLTPLSYDRNIFHIEFDLTGTDLKYAIGEALGVHGQNDEEQVNAFLTWYGLDPEAVISVPAKEYPGHYETKTVRQLFVQTLDIFGKPPKKFYELLSQYATDEKEKTRLLALGGSEGAVEFKRRSEVETLTFADILEEFSSAKPSLPELIKLIPAIKRREYSIASSQKVHPHSVHLLIVEVNWRDEKNRDRYGQCTRYLSRLPVGAKVTVSVKPSVMKLPAETTTPIIMAGLGTGLAPFRAFVQERALQKAMGHDIGPVFLYMGSRHQREEYLYGEEWEAYRDSGVITLLGLAFSRDQAKKVYIQDLMRKSLKEVVDAFISKRGSFYLCGPVFSYQISLLI